MRSHALVQSSPILALARREFGIHNDASLLLPGAGQLAPHCIRFDHGAAPLVRLPGCFEDDVAAYQPSRLWKLSACGVRRPGLRMFTFHPAYIWLNSDRMEPYRALKALAPLRTLTPAAAAPYINTAGAGIGRLFVALCEFLATRPVETATVDQVARACHEVEC